MFSVKSFVYSCYLVNLYDVDRVPECFRGISSEF